MKLPGGVTRTKEGLRKREMRERLNITSPLKKKKKRAKMNFGRRGEKVSVGVREKSLSKTEIVQMSSS